MDLLHNPFARNHQLDEFADAYLDSLKPEVRTEIVERWFMRPKPISGFKLFSYFMLGSGAVYVVSEAISRIIIAAKSTPEPPKHEKQFMLVSAFADPCDAAKPDDASASDTPTPNAPDHHLRDEATGVVKKAALAADVAKAATLVEELAIV